MLHSRVQTGRGIADIPRIDDGPGNHTAMTLANAEMHLHGRGGSGIHYFVRPVTLWTLNNVLTAITAHIGLANEARPGDIDTNIIRKSL